MGAGFRTEGELGEIDSSKLLLSAIIKSGINEADYEYIDSPLFAFHISLLDYDWDPDYCRRMAKSLIKDIQSGKIKKLDLIEQERDDE